MPLHFLDARHRASSVEVSAEATQEPSTVEASISGDGRVAIRVEREFSVELVAETKINVLVVPGGDYEDKDFDFASEDGDYEDLDPDLLDDEL
ncbi:Outer spore coat protein E (CotE) [compost metagenome]